MPNATLRVIAIKSDDEAGAKKISDELTKRYALTTYAGYDEGVMLVSAGNLSSVSGAGQVAIPLAIAADHLQHDDGLDRRAAKRDSRLHLVGSHRCMSARSSSPKQ